MFAEEIGFGFLREGGFENAGARGAESLGVGERERLGFAGSVLMNGEKRGRAAAFGEDFADAMAGSLGSDHADVDILRRLNRAKTNVEAVGEHERLAFREMRLDLLAIELRLLRVWRENHDDIGPSGGLGGSVDREAFLFGFGAGGAAFRKTDADAYAAVTEI